MDAVRLHGQFGIADEMGEIDDHKAVRVVRHRREIVDDALDRYRHQYGAKDNLRLAANTEAVPIEEILTGDRGHRDVRVRDVKTAHSGSLAGEERVPHRALTAMGGARLDSAVHRIPVSG